MIGLCLLEQIEKGTTIINLGFNLFQIYLMFSFPGQKIQRAQNGEKCAEISIKYALNRGMVLLSSRFLCLG